METHGIASDKSKAEIAEINNLDLMQIYFAFPGDALILQHYNFGREITSNKVRDTK